MTFYYIDKKMFILLCTGHEPSSQAGGEKVLKVVLHKLVAL